MWKLKLQSKTYTLQKKLTQKAPPGEKYRTIFGGGGEYDFRAKLYVDPCPDCMK